MTKKQAIQMRSYIRQQCEPHKSWLRTRIEVVEGNSAPTVRGEPSHYEAPGGKRVHYPTAYRRAYGRPIYCASTYAFHVGREWLRDRGISPLVCDPSNDVSSVPVYCTADGTDEE